MRLPSVLAGPLAAILIYLGFGLAGAAAQEVPAPPTPATVPGSPAAPAVPPAPPVTATTPPPTRQRAYAVEERKGGDPKLAERFRPEQLALLEKLNRRDADHLRRAGRLVLPAGDPSSWPLDEMSWSPLPLEWTWAAQFPKALVIDQPWQVFGAYEHGRLVRWGPVSSGRKTRPTPSGLFHLNWRSPGRRSTDDPDWYMRWYFNFDNRRGLALHELELPGYPASHACVRLLARDARWLYDWGEGWTLDERRRNVVTPGTPLLIRGTYPFGTPPPWLAPEPLAVGVELPDDPLAPVPPPA